MPINRITALTKQIEKFLLHRQILLYYIILVDHEFGFRHNFFFIFHNLLRPYELIANIFLASEKKEHCNAVFSDASQIINIKWHDGLLYKIKSILLNTCLVINLLFFFLENSISLIQEGNTLPYEARLEYPSEVA